MKGGAAAVAVAAPRAVAVARVCHQDHLCSRRAARHQVRSLGWVVCELAPNQMVPWPFVQSLWQTERHAGSDCRVNHAAMAHQCLLLLLSRDVRKRRNLWMSTHQYH